MRTGSLKRRFGLLFLAFVLLITVSVGATYWSIKAQQQDALVINLAGRQRMLVQQMARLALEIQWEGVQGFASDLGGAEITFTQTLAALQEGGPAPYLPGRTVILTPAQSPAVADQLDQMKVTWESFHSALDTVRIAAPDSPQFTAALREVENRAPQLADQADQAVRLLEEEAIRKIDRLRLIQLSFFGAALVLLLAGGWMTQHSVVRPLQILGQAAEQIGSGNLDQVIIPVGVDEIRVVAESCERMRVQLSAWSETLEKRVSQRTSELEALYTVNQEISSHLEVEQVLHSVTDKARQLLEAEVATLCLLDEQKVDLKVQAMSGPLLAQLGEVTPVRGRIQAVLAGEDGLPCSNGACGGRCSILAPAYQASHLAAPLRVDGHVMGALCVGSSTQGAFQDDLGRLLKRLASSAAIALENARLYSQAERVAALEERQRLAAEMHDGLGQALSALGLQVDQAVEALESGSQVDALNDLERARQITGLAMRQTREIIASMLAPLPLARSLQDSLSALAAEFDGCSGAPIVWECSCQEPLLLTAERAEQVLHVAREALTNARRYSQAKEIRLCLSRASGEAVLAIRDDGRGFDPACLPQDGRRHFGLQIMCARAAHLGGRVEVLSALDQGTEVRLSFPLAGQERENVA